MKKKIFLLIFVLLTFFMITSCGGGFFEEDVLEIESIKSKIESDGTTILKITYTDPTRNPDEFRIPRGLEGNGIKEITTVKDESGKVTNVIITYTDETMEPVTFNVKDGVSISGVISKVDEATLETKLVVLFSDGTESEPFPLPKGDPGEDGNGFTGFDKTDNEDGSQTYNFHFSKSEDVVITVPAPQKGDSGLGISSIIGSEENGFYVIKITYTDGTQADPIYFNKPKNPNTWLSSSDKPDISIGSDGDYCFDTFHKVIYVKENGIWNKVISFDDSTDYYFVTFDLNDNDGGPKASMPLDSYTSYVVTRNTYFTDNGYSAIPRPFRDGYKFLGWYRSKDELNPTMGMFTDLTPILSDLTLYAHWEKIN